MIACGARRAATTTDNRPKGAIHRAAVALHFAHYNFVRLHKTLRVTLAMAAGVSDRLWTLEELAERTSC
jgi:hypothetical protein